MNRVQIHKGLCENIHTLYEAKNADYGDSFARLRKRYPEAVCIKLTDKLDRLENLMRTGAEPKVNESIEDTLMDLANYALMELTERLTDEMADKRSEEEDLK